MIRVTAGIAAFAVMGLLALPAGATVRNSQPTALPDRLAQIREELVHTNDVRQAATKGWPAEFRAREEHERLTYEAAMTESLVWIQGVIDAATPGSPAQFRALESRDALSAKLNGMGPHTR